MMRICFLGGTRYPRPLDATSEKKFRALASLGKLHVIGFSPDLKPCAFTRQARFYLLPRLPAPILRYVSFFAAAPLLALWCILRHEVEILVAQSPYEGAAAALAKILARFFGRRAVLIVESHGDFEASLFLQRRIWWASLYRFLMGQAARFSLQNAEALRAVSDSTGKQLETWSKDTPLLQFPAWTDLDLFVAAGSRPSSCRQPATILYAGGLTFLKGIHFLLEAFARLTTDIPNARLQIVGQAEDPKYLAGLRKKARKLSLNGQVHFLDHLPQRELADCMAKAGVLVLPSLSEGLPRVVFEALAAGTPVVASAVCGIPQLVTDGVTGFLVPPGDVQTLTERLQWLLQHPDEAEKMGKRGRKFARHFFSTETYVQNYARLFHLAGQGQRNNA